MERKQYRKFEKIRKTQFRDLVNSKLLLNRSELEKIIDTKKMRGDDTFPTVYHMFRSDERFRKNAKKRSLPFVVSRTIFETALKL